ALLQRCPLRVTVVRNPSCATLSLRFCARSSFLNRPTSRYMARSEPLSSPRGAGEPASTSGTVTVLAGRIASGDTAAAKTANEGGGSIFSTSEAPSRSAAESFSVTASRLATCGFAGGEADWAASLACFAGTAGDSAACVASAVGLLSSLGSTPAAFGGNPG